MIAYQQTLNGLAVPDGLGGQRRGLGGGGVLDMVGGAWSSLFANVGGGGGGNDAFFAFAKRQDAALQDKRGGTITGIAVVGGILLAGLGIYLLVKK